MAFVKKGLLVFMKGMLLGLTMAAILCILSANLTAQASSSSDQNDEEPVHVKRRLPLLNGHNFSDAFYHHLL